jgi:hypothetical protein
MVANQYSILDENARLSEADAGALEREATTLAKEVKEAHVAVEKLVELGTAPAAVTVKLCRLSERLAAAQRNADVGARIAVSRKESVKRFLAEGTPTNAELLQQDNLLEKALTTVRRVVGL